ncbi:MAG: DUF3343 domain-containing protein [Spirochaetaceae bacterium]|jgi:hypothetical protein|nr:DUF3343 domain-containing protein [Spirochaetaceae bacterium]
MPEAEEIIICFESAAEAILAEQALTENSYAVRVMPVPAQLRSGCGFCLRFFQHDIKKAAAFLVEHGVSVKDVYERGESGGVYRRVIL